MVAMSLLKHNFMKCLIIVVLSFFLALKGGDLFAQKRQIQDFIDLCDIDAFVQKGKDDQEKELREKLYLQLLGALFELNSLKNKFINEENLIDVFPLVYYNVTLSEMKNIKDNKYKYPVDKLSQMLSFYEAYKFNRDNWDKGGENKKLVEPHWTNHFKAAEGSFNNDVNLFCTGLQQALNSAITAHVVYDLPRAIRFALNNPLLSPRPDENELKNEFFASNSIFIPVLNKSIEEIGNVRCSSNWLGFGNWLIPSDIRIKREWAWYDAVNKKPIIGVDKKVLISHPFNSHVRQNLFEIGEKLCAVPHSSTLFLFDLSGSMMETGPNASIPKLDQAKNASKQTLKALKSNNSGTEDEVAVLGFSGDCVADPTILISDFETDLQVVENRINTMMAGGGTPLAEAVGAAQCKLANHLAQTGQDKGKLILLSDGQATCQAIRPVGTYNSAPLGQKDILVSANQCGNGKQQIKYYTIGFNISPGSPAERDLQYLSQISGGKYLNVQSQTQLERAFRKFNRTYVPKPNPSLNGLPAPSLGKFDEGVNQITGESFPSALKTCGEFAALHPDDCHGAYNLALMQEANDFYKQAIANYKKYLGLCPNAPDRDFVERQIAFLEEEFKQFVLFQKEVIKSDLEYLKLHFERIQNGQSVALAEEFKGFLKEKGNYYKDLPEQIGRTDRVFPKNCLEVATGLGNCAAAIKRNPQTWDRDATPTLSLTYINLERLLDSF